MRTDHNDVAHHGREIPQVAAFSQKKRLVFQLPAEGNWVLVLD
jgi:hypothetical protein